MLCAPIALGQIKLHLKPGAGETSIVTASDLPNRGLAVVWRANESAFKNGDWSPVHAFPVKKHAIAGLPLYNAGKNSAFFRLSWQYISLPDQLAWIPPGRFQMGSPEDEPGRFMDEGPTLKAVVPHGFWMDRYEVTQKNYLNLMGENPSNTEFSPDMPVNRVTWHEAVEYCMRMTDSKRSAGLLPKGYVYRLPT